MRQSSGTFLTEPSAGDFRRQRRARLQAIALEALDRDVSSPLQAERPRSRRPRRPAAARPCRRGWSDGCARSSGDHGAHAEQLVPLAAQSRDEPLPYSTPANTTSGRPSASVLHRRVVDRHRLAARIVLDVAALPACCRRLQHAFLMRMLAKVPRIITSWLPRRVPYWLKSAATPGAR